MRILLVEDDLPLAEALSTLLLGAGYALDVTHDGLSAETLIGAERFDLVILDLNLPEKDGLSVLRSLRARRNGVPILILVAIAVPSVTLIAKQYKPAPAKALTVKATRNALAKLDADPSRLMA